MLDPIQSEVVVLGACLLSEKAADTAVARLTTNDFYRYAHGVVFDAVVRLRNGNRPADIVTVTEVLARADRLDEIGGPVALPDLAASCPSPSNVGHYIDMVLDHARRRQLSEIAAKLGQGAADGSRPLHTLLHDTRDQLEGVRPAGRRLSVYTDDELDHLPPVEWLVDGIIQHRGLNLVFGPWKQGKSFVVLDMCLRILAGMDWHGRPTVQLPSVVYVAAEGASGMARRRQSWRTHHRTHPGGFTLIGSPLSLTDPADVGELDAVVGEKGAGLLVIDTWARCIGGDENSPADAGYSVRALDRIRDRHGCAVLVVHHSGHMDQGRTRGASSLPAAADSQVQVGMSGDTIKVVHSWAKDAPTSSGVELRLTQAGPSAVPVPSGRALGESPDELKQRLRTRLRSTPAKIVELDSIAAGDHALVESVLEESEFEVVDPLEQPARYRAIRSLV